MFQPAEDRHHPMDRRPSLEIHKIADAEPFITVEGNMCDPVMRGVVAPPGSKTTSHRKGMRRNLPAGVRCAGAAAGQQRRPRGPQRASRWTPVRALPPQVR